MDKIGVSILKAFSQGKLDELKEYYAGITLNLSEAVKNSKKIRNQLIITVLIYFIIVQSSVETIEIGPFKIANIDMILKIFPVLMTYKFYEFINQQTFLKMLQEITPMIIRLISPNISSNNLDIFLFDDNCTEIFEIRNNNSKSKILSNLNVVFLCFQFLFLPITIIIYSYFISFSKFGYTDFLVWFSLLINLFLLTTSYILFSEHPKHIMNSEDYNIKEK